MCYFCAFISNLSVSKSSKQGFMKGQIYSWGLKSWRHEISVWKNYLRIHPEEPSDGKGQRGIVTINFIRNGALIEYLMSGVKKGPNVTDVVYGLPLGLDKSNTN